MLIRGRGVDTGVYDDNPMLALMRREHVFVSSESERSWGCLGRGLAEAPNARILAEGRAEEEWVSEIAGPGPEAGAQVINQVTGVCHQAANRILIPIGKTVDDAFGDEIAVLTFGLYGPDTSEVVDIVTRAAERVNARLPEAVPESVLNEAIGRITRDSADEYEVMKNDFEERISIHVDALPVTTQSDLRAIHARFVGARTDIYQSRKAGKIDQDTYLQELRAGLLRAVKDLEQLLGEEKYLQVFKYPPEDAVRLFVK